MRVLILNWRDRSHPRAGGAEVYTSEIAQEWVRLGHQVTWFSAAVHGRPEYQEEGGITHVRRGSQFTVYREAKKWWRSRDPQGFDLVIDEVNTRPFLTPRWLSGPPVVALIHQVCREIWFEEFPWPLAAVGRWWLEPRWLRSYTDVPVLTLSASSKTSLESYGLRRVGVVPVGVHRMDRPAVSKESLPTLITVGRLAKNKRPADALRAHNLLRRRLPDAQLWVVGDGPERAALVRSAGPGVVFHGQVTEAKKIDLMARAHLLLATSRREGWGLVVDEAAAVGTQTIGYDVPGLRDSIPAAGGILSHANPRSLAHVIAARLPAIVNSPTTSGWAGGARPWSEVSAAVLADALALTGDVGR